MIALHKITYTQDGIPIMTDKPKRKQAVCVGCGEPVIVSVFMPKSWVRCPDCVDVSVNGAVAGGNGHVAGAVGGSKGEGEAKEPVAPKPQVVTQARIDKALARNGENCRCVERGLKEMTLEEFKRFEGCRAPQWRCSTLTRIDRGEV